jgi:hypothetical protein
MKFTTSVVKLFHSQLANKVINLTVLCCALSRKLLRCWVFMNTERFATDKIVKLIEFSIKNKKFMPKEAMNASGLVSLEFA